MKWGMLQNVLRLDIISFVLYSTTCGYVPIIETKARIVINNNERDVEFQKQAFNYYADKTEGFEKKLFYSTMDIVHIASNFKRLKEKYKNIYVQVRTTNNKISYEPNVYAYILSSIENAIPIDEFPKSYHLRYMATNKKTGVTDTFDIHHGSINEPEDALVHEAKNAITGTSKLFISYL